MINFSSLAQPGDRKLLGLKVQYAKGMWAIRKCLSAAGLYNGKQDDITQSSENPKKRYLRSLLAIYDVKEMSRLDLAWWTFDAMSWTESFLKSRAAPAVFEYGSGASTMWLARRSHEVLSVEDDPGFFNVVSALKPDNVRYFLHEADADFDPAYEAQRRDLRGKSYKSYVRALEKSGGFYDLIVIDGRCRKQCIELASRCLKPGGAILLDNTDMQRFRGIKPKRVMEKIVTKGLTPCLPYPTETTIFISKD